MKLLNIKNEIRQLGGERTFFLSAVSFGHVAVHWYSQMLPLVIPSLKAELNLSDVQVGTITTAHMGVSSAATLPSGYVADSFYKRGPLILASAILIFGLALLVMGTATFYVSALVAAGLLGLASGLWHPTAIGHLSHRFPDRRGFALSMHGVGASIGDSLAPIAVGAILLFAGWRYALAFHMIPAVIIAFILWKGIGRMYKDSAAMPKPSFKSYLGGLKAMITNRQVVAVTVSNAFGSMARISVITFLPIYISDTLGYSEFILGVYLTLLYVMGMVSQPIMGLVSDKFGRKSVIVPSFLLMGLLFIALAYADKGIQLGLVICGLGCFFYAIVNVTQSAVMDVAGIGVQSSTMGVMSLISQPFTLSAPIIAGFLVEAKGIESVFWYAGVLALLAVVVLIPVRFKRSVSG